jgi:large subunit ribosomal protein L17
MRHRVRGRQLSRNTGHRKALRRNLAQSLIEHGSIRTTLPKAKEVQGMVEKLVTAARKAVNAPNDEAGRLIRLNARRKVFSILNDRRLVDDKQDFIEEGKGARTILEKLFDELAPNLASRAGGYTRIIKLGEWRVGDGGSLVRLEFVTETQSPRGSARRADGLRRKRADRKKAFAARVLKPKPIATSAPSVDAPSPETQAADTPSPETPKPNEPQA